MKLAIPVDENKMDVCVSFGRAPYFMFYDSNTGDSVVKSNPAAAVPGGAGLQAAQLIVDESAEAVLTFRCGGNAADVLKAAGIGIYKAQGFSAAQNIKAFEEKKLETLTQFHAGFHGGR